MISSFVTHVTATAKEKELVYLDEYKDELNYSTTSTFPARENVILRRVWQLEHNERSKLSHYFLLQSTISEYLAIVDTEFHPYKDFLRLPSTGGKGLVEVEYMNCSYDWLGLQEEEGCGQTKLLLSVRINRSKRFAIALIRPNFFPENERLNLRELKTVSENESRFSKNVPYSDGGF